MSDLDREALMCACRVLAAVVRQEYPAHLTLAPIVATWGDMVTEADVDAVRHVEALLLAEERS